MKKIYRKNIELVESLLFDILYNGEHADKWVSQVVKSRPDLGGKDRKFVQNATYDVVRYWLKYSNGCSNSDVAEVIHYALSHYLVEEGYSFPEGYLLPELHQSPDLTPDVLHSIPLELYEFGLNALGSKWHEYLALLNQPKPLSVRVNNLNYSMDKLLGVLEQQQVDFQQVSPNCCVIFNKPRITHWDIYKKGCIEIQDWGSQQILEGWTITKNEQVLDLCAGAGGKLLQMATSGAIGKVFFTATDVVPWKLKNLQYRAKKAGIDNIQVHAIQPFQTQPIIKGNFYDKILIDAPCSGSGVWGRFPDAKYKLKVDDITVLNETQIKLLKTYANCIKIGGEVLYATCSVFPCENEAIVKSFLSQNKGFELIGEKHIEPTNLNDGFYAARLKRIQ